MTPDLLGAIANVAGYIVPLLLSLSIAATYARPYFFRWTLSYLFYLPPVLALAIPELYSGWLGVTAVMLLFFQLGTWYVLRTAEGIRSDRAPFRQTRAAWWVTLLLAEGMLLAGQPLTMAFTAPSLLLVAVHLRFGYELWWLEPAATRRTARTLAILLTVTGLWVLAFPFFESKPAMWIGFVVSGTLHLLVGIQMVIYLLDDVAAMLRDQNARLQELDALKSSFISTVSHELRTPITAIKSAAWLLSGTKRAPEPAELGAIISRQADQLSRLVSDMLDFSVLESGAMAYHRTRFALDELAEEAVQGAGPMFAEKDVALAFEPAAVPVPVEGDPERLKQVIGNMLANALKFTEPGGQVTVTAARLDGTATLAVTDTGVGIAPEHHDRIFERFYQVDGSNTRRAGGAGLGLTISRAIVEEGHQGRLWVESAPGEGSTFVMSLPLAAARGPLRAPRAAAADRE